MVTSDSTGERRAAIGHVEVILAVAHGAQQREGEGNPRREAGCGREGKWI